MKKVLNLKPLGDKLRKETQSYLDGLIRAAEKGKVMNKVETESVFVHVDNPSEETRNAFNDMKQIIVEYMENLIIPANFNYNDFDDNILNGLRDALDEYKNDDIDYEFLFYIGEPWTDDYLFGFNFYFRDASSENPNYLVLSGSVEELEI